MPREWILNLATNRWGLNKKNSVGPVAEWIRECQPRTLDDWRNFYYRKLTNFLSQRGIDLSPGEYLEALGRKLFVKITEVVRAEIEEVTEEDWIQYVRRLVLERTYEGYRTEVETIYGQLRQALGVEIRPARDDWDRRYNVDFYISVGNRYIGLQIKPITYRQIPDLHRWTEWLRASHERFRRRFGGRVFVIYSIRRGNRKVIWNPEVIDDIRREMERLSAEGTGDEEPPTL